jgi:hypothetical protein
MAAGRPHGRACDKAKRRRFSDQHPTAGSGWRSFRTDHVEVNLAAEDIHTMQLAPSRSWVLARRDSGASSGRTATGIAAMSKPIVVVRVDEVGCQFRLMPAYIEDCPMDSQTRFTSDSTASRRCHDEGLYGGRLKAYSLFVEGSLGSSPLERVERGGLSSTPE